MLRTHLAGDLRKDMDGQTVTVTAGPEGLIRGRLGEDMDVAQGAAAARHCGLALIAQAQAALGSLDRVVQVVKLTGFVNSTPGFTDQPEVINGCSDLMVEVFGDAGRHARSAVGVPVLPLDVPVEVELARATEAGVEPTPSRAETSLAG